MSTMVTSTEPAARMTGAQRRDQILAAARRVFAQGGVGASTDDVARAAGVSQPYVVRLFGTKRALLVETYRQACQEILAAMSAVPAGPQADKQMALAYTLLLDDRDLLRLVVLGFNGGVDPEVSALARTTLGETFRLFRERTGADPDAARTFVAQGMLINVLLGVDALEHTGEDPSLDALVQCVLAGTGEAA